MGGRGSGREKARQRGREGGEGFLAVRRGVVLDRLVVAQRGWRWGSVGEARQSGRERGEGQQ